jgi:hypothetical protein
MVKKIFLAMASLFLIWQSFELITKIQGVDIQSPWIILFTAWIINLFVTGVFAFSVFGFPTEKLLPDSYYKIHHPSQLKWWYQKTRTELFRKALLATLWRSRTQNQKYFNGKKEGIAHLDTQSRKSEFGHLIPFVILVCVGIFFMVSGMMALGISTILINILGNFYPVILQRHHRMRIQAMTRGLDKRFSQRNT